VVVVVVVVLVVVVVVVAIDVTWLITLREGQTVPLFWPR